MQKQKKPVEEEIPLENAYQWFKMFYPRNRIDREEIKKMLIGERALSLSPFSVLDYILTPEPGKSTPICKTVIAEDRYRDRDHSKAMSLFYSRSFRQVSNECVRLHLFSRRLSSTDLDIGDLNKLSKSYLGFCVLRPFPQRRVGRTVLKRLWYQPALEFPTCQGYFEVNLAGCGLNIAGSTFMEQDAMVGACASAAIWMSTANIGKRFGLQQYSTAEITQIGSQYISRERPMPSEGLDGEQMVQCLRSMGYEPLLLDVLSQNEAKHEIYSYVESEIAPILLCNFATGGHHTLVAVGHGYQLPVNNPQKKSIDWPGEPPIIFSRSSEWVPYLLANDDQRGIYRKLSFVDKGHNNKLLKNRIRNAHPDVKLEDLNLEEWNCPVAIDINMPSISYFGGEEIANIWGILVPLPPNIFLTAEQAERKSARLIRLWHWLNSIPMPEDLVLRTYLSPSNDYKERIKKSEMDTFVKALLRGKPMPRWIWVTEVSSIESYNSPDPAKWLISGQIIIDATSNPYTPDFLAFHYIVDSRAIFTTMLPEHKDAEQALLRYWMSQRDFKYQGWIR